MSETPSSASTPAGSNTGGASTRRSVLRAAAWTTPVIALAAAAPAYAASPGQCTVMTNYNLLKKRKKQTKVPFTDSDVTMSITLTPGNGWSASDENLTIQQGPQGGIYKDWLKLENVSSSKGANVLVTFTFSKAVSKLKFSLFDLDSIENGYIDAVIWNTEPTSSSIGSGLKGNGTSRTPWQKSSYGEIDSSQQVGNVDLAFDGPITTVQFTYFNNSEKTSKFNNQLIGISNIQFESCK